MTSPSLLAAALGQCLQQRVHILSSRAVSGGSINAAWRVQTDAGTWFIKLNQPERLAMFEAERVGLQALTPHIRVPAVLGCGVAEDQAFIALEWLDLQHQGDEAALGAALAALHRVHGDRYGWSADNTIGSTPQHNAWRADWISFYREQRLEFQLKLAHSNGYRFKRAPALLDGLERFFAGYQPQPSLLHGDLWGGNVGWVGGSTPVLFDPACYFGDRETDLALTSLFGGFGPRFYAAYEKAWPVDAGFALRRDLYNLYHVLNHTNLFGGGYAAQAERLIERLVVSIAD